MQGGAKQHKTECLMPPDVDTIARSVKPPIVIKKHPDHVSGKAEKDAPETSQISPLTSNPPANPQLPAA